MARQILSPSLLRELFSYCQETGALAWRVSPSIATKTGEVVSDMDRHGYLFVKVFGSKYSAHRVAWAIVHGREPNGEIDHLNGNRSDNRLSNLRVVSHTVNAQNRKKANSNNKSSGLLGATFDSQDGSWKAQITVAGKNIHIGRFNSAEDAHQAYLMEKRKRHMGCTI